MSCPTCPAPEYPRDDAVLSADGRFRYLLTRGSPWRHAAPLVVCMLNPSTADHRVDDATIRKLRAFVRRDGHSGLIVVNLCAYRTKDPKELAAAGWLVGGDNVPTLAKVASENPGIVCAWGRAPVPSAIVEEALTIFRSHRCRLLCWGRNGNGSPKHPLYLPGSAQLEDFDGDVEGR